MWLPRSCQISPPGASGILGVPVASTLRSRLRRLTVPAGGALLAASLPLHARAQNGSCVIAGTITSGRIALPGVVISLTTADGQPVDTTSSGADGVYSLKVPGPGRFRLTAALVAFAPIARDVSMDQSSCQQRLDLAMTLASRTPGPETTAPAQSAGARSVGESVAGARSSTPVTAAGRSRGARERTGAGQDPQQFQSLALFADQVPAAGGDDSPSGGDAALQALLPPGFSPDTSGESIASVGSVAAGDQFFGPGGFGERFGGPGDGVPGADGRGGPFARGGPGGPGGFGGRGLAGIGPGGFGGRGRGGNQIRGSAYQSFDTSALDTGPVPLNGQPAAKPEYFQQRFGATLGGPIAIPKVFDSAHTFFFLNYTGNHSRNPYDTYSTVPTSAERNGDLSALGGPVLSSSQYRSGGEGAVDSVPAAEPGRQRPQPAHRVYDDQQRGRCERAARAHVRRGPAARSARCRRRSRRRPWRRGRAGVSNLNIGIHFRHSANTSQNPFADRSAAAVTISAWDIPVGYSFTKAGLFHSIRAQFNRNRAETTNQFAFNQNIAGAAGIQGISTDPFDWGAPTVSIAGFQGLRDMSPSMRTDQTIIDRRLDREDRTGRTRSVLAATSATSALTAAPMPTLAARSCSPACTPACRLRRLPARAAAAIDVAIGPGRSIPSAHRRSLRAGRLARACVADDQRRVCATNILAGIRGGQSAGHARRPPTFTAAVPVLAGRHEPFSGALPDSIVPPIRGVRAARRRGVEGDSRRRRCEPATASTTAPSVYQSIAQQLANQPPFASTNTVLGTRATPCRSNRRSTTATPAPRPTRTASIRTIASATCRSGTSTSSTTSGALQHRRRLHRHEGRRTSTSCARRTGRPPGCGSRACRRSSGNRPKAIRS